MFRSGLFPKSPPTLALTVALAGAIRPPPGNLETIRAGCYSQQAPPGASAKIPDWNIDCGKHFEGIAAAVHLTRPDIGIFQEVDLGARRTHGQHVARDLAGAFDMNYVRGPVACEGAQVHYAFRSSDHFAISPELRF